METGEIQATRQLVYNALRTPDGTVLHSKHRHDLVDYTDKNGVYYMLDGGLDYTRYSSDGNHEFITVYADESIEKVREYFHWGRNYDKDNNRLPETQWIPLKDITDDHLLALCRYTKTAKWCTDLFIKEKQFRNL